jgi:hypothetical protein
MSCCLKRVVRLGSVRSHSKRRFRILTQPTNSSTRGLDPQQSKKASANVERRHRPAGSKFDQRFDNILRPIKTAKSFNQSESYHFAPRGKSDLSNTSRSGPVVNSLVMLRREFSALVDVAGHHKYLASELISMGIAHADTCDDFVRSAGLNPEQVAFVLFDDRRGYAPHTKRFDGFDTASWYEVVVRNTRPPNALPPKRFAPNAQPFTHHVTGSGYTVGELAPKPGDGVSPQTDPDPCGHGIKPMNAAQGEGRLPLKPSGHFPATGTKRDEASIRDRLVHISRGLASFIPSNHDRSDLFRLTTLFIRQAIILEPTCADLEQMNTRGCFLQGAIDSLWGSILGNITFIADHRLSHHISNPTTRRFSGDFLSRQPRGGASPCLHWLCTTTRF